jgi:hypothetical protein
MDSSDHIQETYDGWDGRRPLEWRVDDCQPPVWEHTNSIMSTWKSKFGHILRISL